MFLTPSSYQFSTYNVLKKVANQVIDTPHNAHLEGQWNYLYVSYSALEHAMISFNLFGDTVVRNQLYEV